MTVNFEPWGPAVFKKARILEKPILLSISASWCHWCHEMDRQTYENKEVAALVKENFIAVRVDRDKRPDIDRRYNQGGWPSTVFLTHSGEVLTGATYLPPQDFLETARRVWVIYKDLIVKGKVSRILEKEESETKGGERASFEVRRALFYADWENFVNRFEREVKDKFDPIYGGFGTAPKFPQVSTLRFCPKRFAQTKDRDLFQILIKSLEAYSEGGLFDHLDGGFFRYSSDRRFEKVHFEKLLWENLQLAHLFFDVGQALSEKRFLEVAEGTFSFIKNWLGQDPFYSSSVVSCQDYYLVLSRQGRKTMEKPNADNTILTDLNGLAALTFQRVGQTDESRRLTRALFLHQRDDQGFFLHTQEDRLAPRLLADQAYPLQALTEVYPDETRTAADLLRLILLNFYDEESGGFLDRRREEDDPSKIKIKPLEENLTLIKLLRKFGFNDRAEKSLVEVFNLYREPALTNAPLAQFLIDHPSFLGRRPLTGVV